MSDVTQILTALESGDAQAAEQLFLLVYDELRRLAAQRMSREKPGQTLDATGLVHEAYLRLVGSPNQQRWSGRSHFFAAAAEAMRRIIIENVRRKKRLKRGGESQRVEFDEAAFSVSTPPDELLAVDEALSKLADEDATAAEIVKLRYFVGLSIEEAAESLGVSRASAYRQWSYAKAWLRCELEK